MATGSSPRKRYFVVMGFGIKTDYATGRQINMDKVYKVLIKPVIEDLDLDCVRSDEIRHTGVIDVPMYSELLIADVVVADLSTANLNATYELGVRHALRPCTTVVISENKLAYPFDVNHIAITSYELLDGGIDFDEVDRFRKVLKDKLSSVLENPKPDSPVYTFLNLNPPSIIAAAAAGAAIGAAVGLAAAPPAAATRGVTAIDETSLSQLIEDGEQAIKDSEFSSARKNFAKALDLTRKSQCDQGGNLPPQNPYLIQRLALATYESKKPDPISALNEALKLLESLNLRDSNDPETVGIAGAIEKRLYELGQGADHLATAIKYYERGYVLRNDYYNGGINLAYLMNLRADSPLDPTDADRIADMIYANRTRREVLQICDTELKAISDRECQQAAGPTTRSLDPLKAELKHSEWERKFWCMATKAEAHFGLGGMDQYEAAKAAAYAMQPPPADWMKGTFDQQIGRLSLLLTKLGGLLTPPWPGSIGTPSTTSPDRPG